MMYDMSVSVIGKVEMNWSGSHNHEEWFSSPLDVEMSRQCMSRFHREVELNNCAFPKSFSGNKYGVTLRKNVKQYGNVQLKSQS